MKNNQKIALHITKDAKDSSFVDCNIVGGAKIEGRGTKMIRTSIIQFSHDRPAFWWSGIVLVVGFLADLVSLIGTGVHFWQLLLR